MHTNRTSQKIAATEFLSFNTICIVNFLEETLMKRIGKLAVCLSTLGMIATMAATPDWNSLGKQWWAHVQFLADDSLDGRNTGSEGFEKAAAYVAEQFKSAGLKPAGEKGYVQSVEFNVMQIEEQDSSIELIRDGKSVPVKLGDEMFFDVMHSDLAPKVEASAVFVGYGLAVPELKYDDYAGPDLKGKIAVYVKGGPKNMPTEIKAHYQSGAARLKALAKAGAIGIAVIPNPKATEVPWSRTSASRLQAEMELSDKAAGSQNNLQVAMEVNPAYAEALFAESGHSFAEVLRALDTDKPLPRFPLAVKIKTKLKMKKWKVKSENLAGVLPGSDAALRKEYVVISAHLDHLGIGEPVNGDKIYNGAMDDASGIASLIEIARGLKEAGAKPKRSILFLAVTGEEKGLLGSRYFAEHPTVNRKEIVADLNMDMYLPLFPLKYLEVQGLNESTLGKDVRAVCEQAGVQVQADKLPDHNRFIRSDQYSFIRKGVPSLAFKFGWVPGTPEEKKFNDWYKERYHGPADDLSQPVDLAAAAQFNAILEKLALRVADEAQRPAWKPESFFKRFVQ
jgi:Zn-dependent M28 family amino/carboxypeptidase